MFRKIALKTALLLLLVSIIPGAILSYLSLIKAEDALKDAIMNGFANLAEEKAQAILHHLEDHQIEAQILASHPEIKAALRNTNRAYTDLEKEEIVERILQLDREWASSVGQSPEAARIMAAPLSNFLREYQNSDPDSYGEIFVTDAKGATVAMTRVTSDYYQADETWWINSYAEGKGLSLFDDRGHDQSAGAPVMGTVVPVRDKGEVIGVLKINYKIRGILEIVERTHVGTSGLVFLARSSDSIAAMSRERDHELTNLERELIKGKESGVTRDQHKGKKTIMAHAPVETPILTRMNSSLPVKETTGEKWEAGRWTLFIEMDQEEAFAPIAHLKETIRLVFLLVITLVTLLALFISRRITNPIRELIRGAKILGDGDLNHHVAVKTRDERGELAEAFNKMAANLKTVMASREELRNSEERYRTMIEAMSNCVAVYEAVEEGKDFVFLEFNHAAEITDKTKAAEVIGRRVTEVFPGVRKFGLLDVFQRVYKTGQAEHFPAALYHDDKVTGWRDNFVYKLPSGEVVAIYEDVTERKNAEEAIRLNESRLKTMVKLFQMKGVDFEEMASYVLENAVALTKSSIGFLGVLDGEEKTLAIHAWSKGARKECSVPDSPFHMPIEKAGLWAEAVRQRRPILVNDYSSFPDWKKGLPEGHMKLARIISIPVFDGDRITMVAAVGNKKMAYEESDVHQLTLMMQGMWHIEKDRRLEESERLHREKAAHSDRLKSLGIMAAGIGHEINNPNNFILMNSGLVKEMWDDARELLLAGRELTKKSSLGGLPFDKAMQTVPQLIEDMRRGSIRIKEITSHLRDFSVIQQAAIQRTVNLGEIIASSEALARDLIKKSTHRFTLLVEDLPLVRGNFQKLEQVLVNLITNACHALKGQDKAIEITASHDKDHGAAVIKIRDEGAGMDQETLKRVVEPFFTTRQNEGGTGLGAFICLGIIKEHGGTLEYASAPGKGTTVTITLPEAK